MSVTQPTLFWSPAASTDEDFYWLSLSLWLYEDDEIETPSVFVLPIDGDTNPLHVIDDSIAVEVGPRTIKVPPGVPYLDPGPRIIAKMTGGTQGFTYVTVVSFTDTQGRAINRQVRLYIQWE